MDLYGIFNVLQPVVYPHPLPHLVIFAQLTGGLGDVPFFFDIRKEGEDEAVWTTEVQSVRFPDRTAMPKFVMTVDNVRFPEAGVYVIDLFCHNVWVCDTTLTLG